jgi:cell division protease FtsH
MAASREMKDSVMKSQTQFHVWYVIAAVLGILVLQYFWTSSEQVQSVPYSEFQADLKAGKIANVSVASHYIYATLKTPLKNGKKQIVVDRVEPQIADELSKYNVTYSGTQAGTFLSDLLSWTLPVLFFFGLWYLLFRRMGAGGIGGGLMTVGKSKAKVYVETDTKTTFDDVAGVDEAKDELREIVSFLKNPQQYGRLGARIPKGVLLVGPPGTGKTLLARAVAGEAGVPFFSINGSEFVEMFVGVGAARVRDLFEQARQKAPAIIFIDELDALGRARGAFPGIGGHDEKEQTLNQLLSELDGFDSSSGLVLLAATNRPEILDPALLRAGRFDRQVLVDRPDRQGRAEVAKIYLKKVKLAKDVSADEIAALTPGFTGADIANLVNEAALVATRHGGSEVAMADFTEAVERIVAGLEKKSRILNPHERETVAYHEMGHTLVALSLPGAEPVHKVSIIPRGIGALGYTIQRPTEDRFLMTQRELENKMAVLLGGRAAESIVFDEISTGAADDLAKASDIARSIVTQYGMDPKLGNVTYEKQRSHFLENPAMEGWNNGRSYSEETAREIDVAVRELVAQAFSKALGVLRQRRAVLERGAKALLQKETLNEAELAELTAEPAAPRAAAAGG